MTIIIYIFMSLKSCINSQEEENNKRQKIIVVQCFQLICLRKRLLQNITIHRPSSNFNYYY